MGDQPYTDAELDAGAEALYDSAWDGVPPGFRPPGPPWPEFAAGNQDNADYFRRRAAAVLRAVLPQHAARIGEEIAQIVEAIDDDLGSRLTRKAAAAIARAHTTTPKTGDT